MTSTRTWMLTAAVIALTIGNVGYHPILRGEGSPFPEDYTVVAANETQPGQTQSNADESAKMGKQSGTHNGDEAATPENDTKKVDQPPGQNPEIGD